MDAAGIETAAPSGGGLARLFGGKGGVDVSNQVACCERRLRQLDDMGADPDPELPGVGRDALEVDGVAHGQLLVRHPLTFLHPWLLVVSHPTGVVVEVFEDVADLRNTGERIVETLERGTHLHGRTGGANGVLDHLSGAPDVADREDKKVGVRNPARSAAVRNPLGLGMNRDRPLPGCRQPNVDAVIDQLPLIVRHERQSAGCDAQGHPLSRSAGTGPCLTGVVRTCATSRVGLSPKTQPNRSDRDYD